jgi:glycosyltransferase involved in cell wall biosynthesis
MTAAAPARTGVARVLFVVTTLGRGGAERQVVDLARAYRARGVEVAVAAMLGGPLEAELGRLGVPVTLLGMRRGVADPRAILALAAAVRRIRPDVVHSHMVHANLLARVTRLVAPMARLVCTAHNIDEEGALRELGYRVTDRLADLTTNVSAAATSRYAARGLAGARRLRHVPNGLDLARFGGDAAGRPALRAALGLAAEDVAWLFVGRLDVQKDPATLLRGFSAHRRTHPRARLLVVGDGPLREEARHLAEAEGLGAAVAFLGPRDDVASLMQAADAFVLASRWEGLPMVLLEAAGSGLPIVATDVGGNAEIVLDGDSGRLVRAGDAAALGAAMDHVASMDAAGRAALGARGRALVAERYDLERIADQWLEAYAAIPAGRSARNGVA